MTHTMLIIFPTIVFLIAIFVFTVVMLYAGLRLYSYASQNEPRAYSPVRALPTKEKILNNIYMVILMSFLPFIVGLSLMRTTLKCSNLKHISLKHISLKRTLKHIRNIVVLSIASVIFYHRRAENHTGEITFFIRDGIITKWAWLAIMPWIPVTDGLLYDVTSDIKIRNPNWIHDEIETTLGFYNPFIILANRNRDINVFDNVPVTIIDSALEKGQVE